MVTLYSSPNCPSCNITETLLKNNKIPYQKVDVSNDEKAGTFVKGLGYRTMPVVFVDNSTHWSGVNMGKIKALTQTAISA